MFYKNFLFIVPMFWYGILNTFSAQMLYEQWIYQLYNKLFSCIPIAYFAVFDQEYDRKTLHDNPSLYSDGPNNKHFNYTVFWSWIFYGLCNACVILFPTVYTIEGSVNSEGKSGGFWIMGMVIYSSIVILVTVEVLFRHSIYNLGCILFSFGSIGSFFVIYGL